MHMTGTGDDEWWIRNNQVESLRSEWFEQRPLQQRDESVAVAPGLVINPTETTDVKAVCRRIECTRINIGADHPIRIEEQRLDSAAATEVQCATHSASRRQREQRVGCATDAHNEVRR